MPSVNFSLELEGIANFATEFARQFQQQIDIYAMPRYRDYALEVVQEQIQARPGEAFQLEVDGKVVDSVLSISTAKRTVRVRFITDMINVAVQEFSNIIASEMQKRGRRKFWDPERDSTLVKVFVWRGETRQLEEITGRVAQAQIDPMKGDSITMIPASPMTAYANSVPKTKGEDEVHPGGFMGMAAKRIRTRLGAGTSGYGARRGTREASVIRVAAVRSLAAAQHMPEPLHYKDKWRATRGIWTIRIYFLR